MPRPPEYAYCYLQETRKLAVLPSLTWRVGDAVASASSSPTPFLGLLLPSPAQSHLPHTLAQPQNPAQLVCSNSYAVDGVVVAPRRLWGAGPSVGV